MDIKNYTQRKQENLVQKVLQYNDNLQLSFPGYVSEKLDGVFALAIVENNNVNVYSRTGKQYTSVEHLKNELKRLASDCNFVFIGELYTPGRNENIISGWARDTKRQHPLLNFYIHDYMPLNEFTKGLSKFDYNIRQSCLKIIFNESNYKFFNIHCLKQLYIENLQELKAYAHMQIINNCEGVVYRYAGGLWQAGKRNTDMIKIKKELTIDLLCVDVVEGVGKCAGMLGKIVCKSANDKIINVGTGFDNEQRLYYFNNPSEIINKIITISAMEKSKNGLLRQPTFKTIRHDKTSPEEI